MDVNFKPVVSVFMIFMISFVECQISKSPGDKSPCDGTNVDLDWVYDNPANFATVTWTFINSSSASKTIMQHSLGGAAPVIVDNFNVVFISNGGITLTKVDERNSGSYKITVTYLSGSPVENTVSVTVQDCSTTTTTTTTTPAFTTTTPPASTTTTPPPASRTTTMAASRTTTNSTTTTTTTSTTTATAKPTTKKSSLTTTTTFVTTPSTTSLSDKMIIVVVVVPVGVIAVVGTIIFFCLFYRLRRGERKPTSQERHKHGKHYKGNMRPVQQHQQQPYILYGRGNTRESNNKETKRSRSLHDDDRYNWYDGYHWGNQVKQNPVYKDDRNLSRLYYNEMLPRYDDYRSGYSMGHVYPSHISGYQYRPDYHGDSRRHGNSQYSSYPVYSRQQEYINPSYSYIGY